MDDNKMTLKFLSRSENEAFARSCIQAFCLQLNPTLSELNDIKTAVSEAVTNAVVHAYPDNPYGEITLSADISGKTVHISISDDGAGIDDVKQALEPFFTTKPDDERSGMGFTVMQTFMDGLAVTSQRGHGTVVKMEKTFSA